MGLNVDEPGSHDQALRVDLATGGAGGAGRDRDDAVVADDEIASNGVVAGAVQDPSAANDEVIHEYRVSVSRFDVRCRRECRSHRRDSSLPCGVRAPLR
jgi:hypothetical protein